jgi:hypothetical protein
MVTTMRQMIRFDSDRDALAIGGRVRSWSGSTQLILHRTDTAGYTAIQLRNALLRAQDHYGGDADVVYFAETDDIDFDEDYVFVAPVSLNVLAPRPYVEIDFFNDRDERELEESTVERLLTPILERFNLQLQALEVDPSYMSGPPWLWHVRLTFTPNRRPLESLLAAADAIDALLAAFQTGALTRESARDLILGGHSQVLVGQRESDWLEAKSTHYDLSTLSGRVDLSLAAARFANSPAGGLIVFGARTKSVPGGEVIRSITPMPVLGRTAQRYRTALRNHLYPPVEGLRIEVVPTLGGELVIVEIPPQPEELRPFLVHGAIVDGRSQGAFIGIVRRDDDVSIPTTAAMIHSTLAAGRALLRQDNRPARIDN